ncbi:CheW protein [Acidimicrobium ferrooxidans DSM 10331]|uniref:CheW protein n=1 Tax=Acidimicrobium ferrooxidans (strain DSM 10331 / JCM 15462 / NBRC 103882 / ICP) TaxID=525909 RepID=C7M284_ACIFD|nr:chemotaxis protein CheW [Acidimicrobium ferrooxidans]ACU53182.1 CheW protein [Acidimicrobium ferrooxidans DSM 10331]
MSEVSTLATFQVAHLRLALDVERVQEVLRRQEVTPVPLAPSSVEGLINLRGQIVTALDLADPLGVTESGTRETALIVRVGDELLALLVDDVGDVIEVPDEQRAPIPETLLPPLSDLAANVVVGADDVVVVLDLERLLGAFR